VERAKQRIDDCVAAKLATVVRMQGGARKGQRHWRRDEAARHKHDDVIGLRREHGRHHVHGLERVLAEAGRRSRRAVRLRVRRKHSVG